MTVQATDAAPESTTATLPPSYRAVAAGPYAWGLEEIPGYFQPGSGCTA